VINGCSDLFVAVLGEKGRHARSAVGMSSLLENITVEIEVVIRVLSPLSDAQYICAGLRAAIRELRA
jgi:hypothetical protein